MDKDNIWAVLLAGYASEFDRIRNQFYLIGKAIRETAEQLNDPGKQIAQFLQSHRSEIKKFAEILKDKNIIETILSEYVTDTHKKLTQSGYYVSLSDKGFSISARLKELLDRGDIDDTINYLLQFLKEKDTIEYIGNKWSKNKFFNKRIKFLKRGLKAHLEEDYICSIPVLMPHVEAIMAEFFVDTGLMVDIPKKFQGNDAIKVLKNFTVDEICTELDRIYFRRFLDKKGIYEYTNDDNKLLNRGKVLHGTNLDYDKEDWSAQIIYMLDFICDLSNKNWILEKNETGRYVLKNNRNNKYAKDK